MNDFYESFNKLVSQMNTSGQMYQYRRLRRQAELEIITWKQAYTSALEVAENVNIPYYEWFQNKEVKQ